MKQIIVSRVIQIRVWRVVVAILLATLPVLGQEAKTVWSVAKGPKNLLKNSGKHVM